MKPEKTQTFGRERCCHVCNSLGTFFFSIFFFFFFFRSEQVFRPDFCFLMTRTLHESSEAPTDNFLMSIQRSSFYELSISVCLLNLST